MKNKFLIKSMIIVIAIINILSLCNNEESFAKNNTSNNIVLETTNSSGICESFSDEKISVISENITVEIKDPCYMLEPEQPINTTMFITSIFVLLIFIVSIIIFIIKKNYNKKLIIKKYEHEIKNKDEIED